MPKIDDTAFGDGRAFRTTDTRAEQGRDVRRTVQTEMAGALMDRECPNDLRELGQRHGVPFLTDVVWKNGFEAGWRMAVRQRAIQQEAAEQ